MTSDSNPVTSKGSMFSDNGLAIYKDEADFLSDLQLQYKSEVTWNSSVCG